jgi:endonuclease YncB( thermonuclease family)
MSCRRLTWCAWCAFSIFCVGTLALHAGVTPIGEQDQPDHPPLPRYPDEAQLIHGRVVRVLDENTLLIRIGDKNERYDLLGVASFRRSESQNAKLVIVALSRLVLHEQVAIHHDPNGKRDASNRLTGFLYRQPDRSLVNLELVRQGYTRHDPTWMSIHEDIFAHFAAKSEALERGIWGEQVEVAKTDETELPEKSPADPVPVPQRQIFVTKHGKKYHREECPHLTDSAKPTTRDQVQDSHEPCKTCKPDER